MAKFPESNFGQPRHLPLRLALPINLPGSTMWCGPRLLRNPNFRGKLAAEA